MKILLVEDNDYKCDRLTDFLRSAGYTDVTIAGSVSSAKKIVKSGIFDFAILDMTLPTYDLLFEKGANDSQEKGGMEVARYISKYKPDIRFIFVTQHEYFDSGSSIEKLDDIDQFSRKIYGDSYLGYVFYEHSGYEWKEKIKGFFK
jgi:CheY-like chemotaxis protein